MQQKKKPELRPTRKIQAQIDVCQREDGRWQVRAVDTHFKMEMTELLPDGFSLYPETKRKYWLQKTYGLVARRMKAAILHGNPNLEKDKNHGIEQGSESVKQDSGSVRDVGTSGAQEGI